MPGFLGVGDVVFAYAYPVSFLGALFYGIASIVSFDPSTVVANKNVSVILNAFIGVCGVISLFNWFNQTPVPVLGSVLLPNGQKVVKAQQ